MGYTESMRKESVRTWRRCQETQNCVYLSIWDGLSLKAISRYCPFKQSRRRREVERQLPHALFYSWNDKTSHDNLWPWPPNRICFMTLCTMYCTTYGWAFLSLTPGRYITTTDYSYKKSSDPCKDSKE